MSRVIPTYRSQRRRAVSRIDVARGSSSGPGASDSISCRPPTRSRGRTASARTMIPMPPSQAVNCRHIAIEWLIAGMSVSMLDPVVVIPDIASK